MTKLLKIAAKTIGFLFEWILILLIAFAFLIRSFPFQTYLAHQATAFLSKELNTQFEIGRVEIVFLNKILLKDVLILDLKKDSILYSKEISLKLEKIDFFCPLNPPATHECPQKLLAHLVQPFGRL